MNFGHSNGSQQPEKVAARVPCPAAQTASSWRLINHSEAFITDSLCQINWVFSWWIAFGGGLGYGGEVAGSELVIGFIAKYFWGLIDENGLG